AAEVIAPILKMDRVKLESDLKSAVEDHRGFMWIKRKASFEESRRLRDLHLEWIEFQTESVREYPDVGIAAHLLGGVYKEEEGLAGVEKSFAPVLKGHAGTEAIPVGVGKKILTSQPDKPVQPGQSLTLSVDARIQFVAEQEIKAAVQKHH